MDGFTVHINNLTPHTEFEHLFYHFIVNVFLLQPFNIEMNHVNDFIDNITRSVLVSAGLAEESGHLEKRSQIIAGPDTAYIIREDSGRVYEIHDFITWQPIWECFR